MLLYIRLNKLEVPLKLFSILVAASLVSAPAFAKTVKCRAADAGNSVASRTSIPVTVVPGARVVKTIETSYAGYKLSVIHQVGDRFDSQTMLTLNANDMSARTVNVSEKSGYSLMTNDLFLQCWFE